MTNPSYASPNLLAETGWLADHLNDPKVCVVDMDVPLQYAKAHIPGAVGIPAAAVPGADTVIDNMLKPGAPRLDAPRFVADASQFKALMQALGISDDTTVVAYDSNKSLTASRMWWALSLYGHPNVKILNGGWKKWNLEGRPVEVVPSKPAEGSLTPELDQSLISNLDQVMAEHTQPGVCVWDTRSRGEYTGEDPRGAKRGGRIPGALHLEWLDLMNDADHTFRSADEMQPLLNAAGITRDKKVHAI